MAEVFYADLIGVPFRYGARGPDAFDCYGLVMEMHRRAGLTLPDFGFADNAALAAAMMGTALPQWKETARAPGAVVLLRMGRLVSHVGFMLDLDRMIHCWEQSNGVSVTRLDHDWERRVIGFFSHEQD